MGESYKEAGVDIEAGEKAVSNIEDMVSSTYSSNVKTDLGAFGGGFAFPVNDYEEPVLVSSTDGVGTKLIVANKMNKHDTVGQCLVNHCVDDILTIGAKPLYFLDYVGIGQLEQEVFHSIVEGITKACKENNCSLVGGETAEMPDIYGDDHYDLVGTITGVVEKKNILDNRIEKGDVLLGLPSSGIHTNGFTLARSVLFEEHSVDDYVEELGTTVGEEMLKIHRSYLKPVSQFLDNEDLHGISHVTGGGIKGNTERIVPEELSLDIDWNAWEWLPIFKYIQNLGNIDDEEMKRVFNLGIGLILVVDPKEVDTFKKELESQDEEAIILGEIK